MSNPFLSVCIPVYGTEPSLYNCLESLVPLAADFPKMEVIVLSDCSSGQDAEGRNCKQIVKSFIKSIKKLKIKIPVTYCQNSENLGTNETRRKLVYEARGKYIFMMDSDDKLVPEGMLSLLKTAMDASNDYDILNGTFTNAKQTWNCEIFGHQIFNSFLETRNIPGFLWTKLIKRELFLEAYDKITTTYCNLGEDFMALFFITWYANSYYSTDTVIYDYKRDGGITSKTKIDSISRWEKVCSTASCFSIIYMWIDEQVSTTGKDPLTKKEYDSLGNFAVRNVILNLKQLEEMVVPELQPQARKMLGEYWGEKLIQSAENKMKDLSSTTDTNN